MEFVNGGLDASSLLICSLHEIISHRHEGFKSESRILDKILSFVCAKLLTND